MPQRKDVSLEEFDARRSDDDFVTVVSTRTIDRIPEGGSLREMPGGPAHFIPQALQRLSCPYQLITGEVALVDVLMTERGEQYVIPELPPISLPPRLDGRATILSPIMREIHLDVPPVSGLLALDLQGFVRDPGRPTGEAGELVDLTVLLERTDIVKAGAHELEHLTQKSLSAMRHAIVLITMGHYGSVVRTGGQDTFVPATAVPTINTIGAGDNYIAAFVYALTSGRNPLESARFATTFTEDVLRERLAEATT